MGWDVLGVQGHGGVDAFKEQVLGHGRDGDEGGGVGEAVGVLPGAEDGDGAGG